MSEPAPRFDEDPPPGKYGRMTVLPHAGPGNLTPEEMAWPLTDPVRRVNSHLLADTMTPGNLTAEELSWPVVDTGSEVITPSDSPEPPAAGVESSVRLFTKELGDLLNRTPLHERDTLLQRLRGVLSDLSADRPAA